MYVCVAAQLQPVSSLANWFIASSYPVACLWRQCSRHYSCSRLTVAQVFSHAFVCFFVCFLLLARYVPNVAKRSIWDQCKKKYILRTDRPTLHLAHIGEISNGHISARGRSIHFMFGSTVGFSRSADRMAIFPVSPNPRWRLGRHLEKFKWRYLSSGSCDLLCVWF